MKKYDGGQVNECTLKRNTVIKDMMDSQFTEEEV